MGQGGAGFRAMRAVSGSEALSNLAYRFLLRFLGLPLLHGAPQAGKGKRSFLAWVALKDRPRRPAGVVAHFLRRLLDHRGQGRGCAPCRGIGRRGLVPVDEAAPLRGGQDAVVGRMP